MKDHWIRKWPPFIFPVFLITFGIIISTISYKKMEAGQTISHEGIRTPASSGVLSGGLMILLGVYILRSTIIEIKNEK